MVSRSASGQGQCTSGWGPSEGSVQARGAEAGSRPGGPRYCCFLGTDGERPGKLDVRGRMEEQLFFNLTFSLLKINNFHHDMSL